MNAEPIYGVYLFGSAARGDADERSDIDVLAVVRGGSGTSAAENVLALVPAHLRGRPPSIAWYGADRIAEMFREGHLFAWHLFHEGIPLYEREGFLRTLGPPTPYRDAWADIEAFRAILGSISENLANTPSNAVYEMGLIYVCARNIAMAASWTLCVTPDFSRFSPFNLPSVIPPRISRRDYETAMTCRMASQRGGPPPRKVDSRFVLKTLAAIEPWAEQVHLCLREGEDR